jgi:hypothetical protein
VLVWFEFNRFSVVRIRLKVSSSLKRVEDVAFCTRLFHIIVSNKAPIYLERGSIDSDSKRNSDTSDAEDIDFVIVSAT